MNREHAAAGDGRTSMPSAIAARVRPLLFIYLVIPAKAGISVKHGNTAPHDRDSRLRGNDEKVATRPVSIRTGMKEDAGETPAQVHVRPPLFPYPVTPAKHPVIPAKYSVVPATYSVIPAKAGISVKHGNTTPHDRDSRLRGNDEKVATRPVSIRTGVKEDAGEAPARPRRAAP